MNKMYNLSICLSDIPEWAIKKASNGKSYVNATLWINQQKDQFGNIGSVSYDKKEKDETKRAYIGRVREVETKENNSDSWKEHLAR